MRHGKYRFLAGALIVPLTLSMAPDLREAHSGG